MKFQKKSLFYSYLKQFLNPGALKDCISLGGKHQKRDAVSLLYTNLKDLLCLSDDLSYCSPGHTPIIRRIKLSFRPTKHDLLRF